MGADRQATLIQRGQERVLGAYERSQYAAKSPDTPKGKIQKWGYRVLVRTSPLKALALSITERPLPKATLRTCM